MPEDFQSDSFRPEDLGPRRWYLVAGVVVVAIGLWLLLEAVGVPLPRLGRSWPLFVLLGGLASMADFFVGSRKPSSLGRGTAGVGCGLLFFGFTTGALVFADLGDWWPAIPLLAGAGFLTTYFAGRMEVASHLVLGIAGLGLGLTAWTYRFHWLERLMPPPAVAWGILLLILGALLLARTLRARRGGA